MMASTRKLAAVALVTIAVAITHPATLQSRQSASPASSVVSWPPVTNQTRPWTRWWWMGSAVDAAGLTTELEGFRAIGLGGIEITPIYGVSGAETQFLPYLSDRWVGLLEHTVREAGRLDLGVDLATGTGWPFGGPWIGERDACRALAYRTWTVEGGQRLPEPVRLDQRAFVRAIGNQIYEVLDVTPGDARPQGTRQTPLTRAGAASPQIADLKDPVESNANLQALALEQVRYPKPLPLQALVGYSAAGEIIDLTNRVASDGKLDWRAPPGTWTLYGVFLGWHGKLVERAAPGGEGNVIDHFSRDAIQTYLTRFDAAFAGRGLGGLRAFFNDSYEVDDADGQANGTLLVFDEFERRRGYDLRRHLPALFASDTTEVGTRIAADYRLTIAELLHDNFTVPWRDWARKRGAIVRNQAHGSPGNLLDLYAASDIPETEGTEIARARWASSAGHVAGRQLISAEAATWLGEHFRSTLADVRAAIDRFFIAGVNHIVFHGTAYSPPQEPWPGWQFYASVEFNSRNSWWADFAALNHYVTRVQSFLQAGAPDHDVLVYYPFYDALAGAAGTRLAHFGTANPASGGTAFEAASETLERRGFTYDFISDRQLASLRASSGTLVTSAGGSYKTLVVPASRFIPLETFERILELARNGAVVVAFKGLTADVAGYAALSERRARLRTMKDALRFGPPDADGIRTARPGRGTILHGDDLERLLGRANVSRESLVDLGLQLTRRRDDRGRYYFIVNGGDRDVDTWIALDDRAPGAIVFDPMTGRHGDAASRRSSTGVLEVQLAIPSHSSLIVATTSRPVGRPFPAFETAGSSIEIRGPWQVRFVAGGLDLPRDQRIDSLRSWTTFDGDEVKRFSGTAIYRTTFERPAGTPTAWLLDLGRVHESARVTLNGREVGTLIGPTFRLTLDPDQLAASNVLEIHVSNLMANRIAALDKAGVPWRKFYNVNFPARLPVNRGPDGLFTAREWEPLDSGLLGPVTLTPQSPKQRPK
jgi:hypothetical protein